jgi:hypothetical protein
MAYVNYVTYADHLQADWGYGLVYYTSRTGIPSMSYMMVL